MKKKQTIEGRIDAEIAKIEKSVGKLTIFKGKVGVRLDNIDTTTFIEKYLNSINFETGYSSMRELQCLVPVDEFKDFLGAYRRYLADNFSLGIKIKKGHFELPGGESEDNYCIF